jgi:hypothetical protein
MNPLRTNDTDMASHNLSVTDEKSGVADARGVKIRHGCRGAIMTSSEMFKVYLEDLEKMGYD